MKIYLNLSVIALAILLSITSCKKEEEINVFKFKVNGISEDYSEKIETGSNLCSNDMIKASSGENHLSLIMKKFEPKEFTENDYDGNEEICHGYEVFYKEGEKTFYYDPNYDGCFFKINITFLNDMPGGRIKGKFSAKLIYRAILSDSTEVREISEGEFTTKLD